MAVSTLFRAVVACNARAGGPRSVRASRPDSCSGQKSKHHLHVLSDDSTLQSRESIFVFLTQSRGSAHRNFKELALSSISVSNYRDSRAATHGEFRAKFASHRVHALDENVTMGVSCASHGLRRAPKSTSTRARFAVTRPKKFTVRAPTNQFT